MRYKAGLLGRGCFVRAKKHEAQTARAHATRNWGDLNKRDGDFVLGNTRLYSFWLPLFSYGWPSRLSLECTGGARNRGSECAD